VIVIATECPTCGAPLDLGEGANAVRCGHCGATHLVTGRKQTLGYSVAPRLDAAQAVARVASTAGRRPTGTPVLHFVPYYRLTGHEFRWQRPPEPRPVPGPRPRALPFVAGDLVAGSGPDDLQHTLAWAAGLLAALLRGDAPTANAAAVPAPPPPVPRAGTTPRAAPRRRPGPAPVFHDRYVDRSFLALGASELGVPSLGVRTGVLRVRLFQREALEATGRVAPVEVTEASALEYGMETPDAERIVHRTVIGRVLSLAYFPFWLVPHTARPGSALAVVDAVADTAVALDAPAALAARLAAAAAPDVRVAGLRPLLCPNCGWELPVRPDDVIFACETCERAWQIHGAELCQVPFEVAEVPGTRSPAAVHLPFWVLDTEAGGRMFSPAFRFRRLKYLSDLARNFARTPPAYGPLLGPRPPLVGCHYDVEDAILLARFTRAGLDPGAPAFTVRGATLTWFPFRREQRALRDPFTGLPLPEHLLDPAGGTSPPAGLKSR
jgi:LSD1 subclass zinc finger protein